MTTTEYKKPIPVPDEKTSGFWEAARQHQLSFQRCNHCGYFFHPPTIYCSNCNAFEPSFGWTPVSGKGKVKSWVVMYDPLVSGFEDDVPWVNVLVQLDEQEDLLFLSGLEDGPNAPIKLGAPVEVTFKDVSPEISIPYFKLA